MRYLQRQGENLSALGIRALSFCILMCRV